MHKIDDNLHKVTARIRQAVLAAGRDPAEVSLLAVSKSQPVSALEQAYAAGQRMFGENYVQEAVNKILALARLADIEWHFIGPLQSNKTRVIAQNFDWVHSIDRLKIAQRLSEQRPASMPPLQVCVQVNLDAEVTKSGVGLAELPALARQIAQLPNLTLRGLMAIPAPAQDSHTQRATFARLRAALNDLTKTGFPDMDTLSMGMSGDLEAAIAEGATVVRVGTDIFGPREPQRE